MQEFLNPSDQRALRLEALADEEALDLSIQLLRQRGVIDQARSEACAKASHNIPVIIDMFAMHLPPDGEATLKSVVTVRVGLLPEAARDLLETVAVSARPLLIDEWFEAAGYDGADGRVLEDRLKAERFIRNTGSALAPRIEIYHDRIRETILAGLSPEGLRQRHWHLALALRKGHPPGTDPEVLAFHFKGAGEFAEASRYYGEAAADAAGGLAFERAADLCRRGTPARARSRSGAASPLRATRCRAGKRGARSGSGG